MVSQNAYGAGNGKKNRERNFFEDFFHPLCIMLPFVVVVALVLIALRMRGATIQWLKVIVLMSATESWSFGWHLNRHHPERRQESVIWRLVAVVIITALFILA